MWDPPTPVASDELAMAATSTNSQPRATLGAMRDVGTRPTNEARDVMITHQKGDRIWPQRPFGLRWFSAECPVSTPLPCPTPRKHAGTNWTWEWPLHRLDGSQLDGNQLHAKYAGPAGQRQQQYGDHTLDINFKMPSHLDFRFLIF